MKKKLPNGSQSWHDARMLLKTYMSTLTARSRARLAKACGCSVGHLANIACGYRRASARLAVALEAETGGMVSRRDLRSDWKALWPKRPA